MLTVAKSKTKEGLQVQNSLREKERDPQEITRELERSLKRDQ